MLTRLDGIMTREQFLNNQQILTSLIFMELEAEKNGEEGGGGIDNTFKTMKNIQFTTAQFGT
jgi:hypothetical protein